MISTPEQHRCGHVLPRSVGFLLILLGSAGLFCGTAGAQPDPANPDDWLQSKPDETLARNRVRVQQMFVGGFSSDADLKLLADYYKRYDLKRWTMVKNRADLEGYRRQLQVDLRNAGKKTEVHQALSALVLDFMTKLAADYSPKDFHPASRVNAILMIGNLNDKEEPAGPAPKAAALPVLTKEVALAHAQGAKYGYINTSSNLPLLDAFLEAEVDVLVGVDPQEGEGSDMAVIKEKLGGKVALWGGVNGYTTVEIAETDQIEAAVGTALDVISPGGGVIISAVDNVKGPAVRTWLNVLPCLMA